MNQNTGILGNEGSMTVFSFGNQRIKFKAPDCLERYVEIKEWDNGYIVVMTQYRGIGIVEEYIDLIPVLENLYINSEEFLKPINNIIISNYDR